MGAGTGRQRERGLGPPWRAADSVAVPVVLREWGCGDGVVLQQGSQRGSGTGSVLLLLLV